MQSKSVVGLGFGDCGKGLVVNYLSSVYPESVVVRHSGGQQAGHTVVKDNIRHVFSNFGSGTLQGCPTYWSKYCSFDPLGIYNELKLLKMYGANPMLYVDKDSPITTPFDKIVGREGLQTTCGVGVGQTFKREESFYHLKFGDIFNKTVFDIKYEMITEYYKYYNRRMNSLVEEFLFCIDFIRRSSNIVLADNSYLLYKDIIFESSQGLLLDQHYGFFPYVTRSNVGTTNIRDMAFYPKMWLVTRAYQTRHGGGPMTNEKYFLHLKENLLETNVTNHFQGIFKKSVLDLDLLNYSISADPHINKHRDNLVITCLDQFEGDYSFTYKQELLIFNDEKKFVSEINNILKCDNLWISKSDDSKLIQIT